MKKRLSIALGIMIILALACLFMAYFQTEDVYEEYKIHEESGLGEGSYKGVVRIVIAIYILFTLFFLAPLYTYVGAKTSVQDTRRKTGLLALGYGLFGFFAIFDGLVTLDAIQVIIVRAGLASALLSIYLGYTLPSWVDSLIDAIASKIRK